MCVTAVKRAKVQYRAVTKHVYKELYVMTLGDVSVACVGARGMTSR